MCWERAGVVSETKPLPGHAISARAGLGQTFGSARQPAKKKKDEEKNRSRGGSGRGGMECFQVKDGAV